VLVTGPTGSGKTSTLYSALGHLNRADTKILTAEDPVEYRLDRINQVQVNPKIGLDFARVLRSMLRQDPDVVLIGEMRDRETVEIALRAAITGHLVFSTLHTLSASATLSRLLDMGAPGYLVATALHGIVAQRLLRQVCADCAQPHEPGPNEMGWLRTQVGEARAKQMRFRSGAGCTYCGLSGYRGRAAIHELIEVDGAMAEAIRTADSRTFQRIAHAQPGYTSLTQGAIALAAAGGTTLAEAIATTSGIDAGGLQTADQDAADEERSDAILAGRQVLG
jgi:MSHA biogenesis protein MshE